MYDRNILVEQTDPELFAAIQAENARQEHHIELIASENYASPAVMWAQGTQLTNKYAEGYPGKRYYGGCEHVDVAEQLAIDRDKKIFGAEHVNGAHLVEHVQGVHADRHLRGSRHELRARSAEVGRAHDLGRVALRSDHHEAIPCEDHIRAGD